jgi:hypothetical protein
MKKCILCQTEKEESCFYKDAYNKDGLMWRCKECERRFYQQKRARHKKTYCEKDRRWYKKHRAEVLQKRKEWYLKNRHKRRAHEAVKRALKNGDLLQLPCQFCGAAATEAHHTDYTKPLCVDWLCRSCHQKKHNGA